MSSRIVLKAITLFVVANSALFGVSLEDYVDKKSCDQIVDKQLYQICYSYKYKSALSGWVTLDGNIVNKVNIKKRPRFYNEKTIPMQYRTKYADYNGYGKDWNRGHFVVSDADFDYDQKALVKSFTMANIIAQSSLVNQKTWIKAERYGRLVASKLGTVNSISLARYDNPEHKIGNNIVIPSVLYRIYYNNDANFEKCFKYDNVLNVDYERDQLRDHEIDCNSIKLHK